MPRSTKDSDDDAESKTGRTRIQKLNIHSTVTNSPLRRSSRIKQGKCSPTSSESDTSSISNSQPIRNTRSRTSIMDNIVSETLKGAHTRKPSISSDISESIDIDILGTPKKRTTRRSLAAVTSVSTPTKINTRASKRLMRAGSETKSPAIRTTRKTRASSVDPESLSEQNRSNPGTPVKTSLIKDEDEKKNLIPYVRLDATIVEADEFTNSGNSDSSPDKAVRSQQSQRINKKRQSIHKNEVEEDNSHVDECKFEENPSSNNSTTDEASMQDNFSNLSSSKEEDKLEVIKNSSGIEKTLKQSTVKELIINIANLSNTSVEEQKESLSNKENQTLNIIDTLESNIQSTNVTSLSTKCLTPIPIKSNEKEIKFTKNESSSNKRRHSKESIEAIIKHDILSKEVTDDIEKKMDISTDTLISDLTYKQNYIDSPSVNDVTKRQSLVYETDSRSITNKNKSILSQYEDVELVDKVIVKNKTPVKQISKFTENTIKETTKSDKIDKMEYTIIDIDSDSIIDLNKDSNIIKLNKSPCLSENKNKIKQESDNKKNLSSISAIDNNEMKLVLKEQNLYLDENESSSNRSSHFNSDRSIELIVMSPVNKNSNNQSNLTEKQSVITQDNVLDNTDFTEQEQKNSSKHAIESILESSNIASKTVNSTSNELNETDAVIHDIQSSNRITEISEKFTTNISSKETEIKNGLKNTVKQDLKNTDNKHDHLEKEKKNLQLENQQVRNSIDSVNVDINVFHEISNDNSNKKKIEEKPVETSSVCSNSQLLKEPENENEAECDLVLVDKKAWLAAENMKAAKEAEPFEYDSDDTVLLKSRLDAMTTNYEKKITNEELLKNQINTKVGSHDKKSLTMVEEEKMDYDNETTNLFVRQKKYKVSSLSSTEDEDDLIAAGNKSINEFKTVSNQNNDQSVSRLNKSGQNVAKPTEQSFKTCDASNEQSDDDTNESNKSSQVNKKKKVLSKSMKRRKSLNTSSKDTSLRQEDKALQNNSINKSREDYSEKELNNTNVHLKKKSQNKDKNTSECEEKNLSKSVDAQTSIHLNDNQSDDLNDNDDISIMSNMTLEYFLLCDSDIIENNSGNTDSTDNSDTDYIDDSTSIRTSIHSDINREYNLDGKEKKCFDDDDVPADECRASESEVSDPDDNGSDLADFIVDDDEIKEDDDDDDDDNDDNDNDDEEKEESNNEEESKHMKETKGDAEKEEVDESENEQSVKKQKKTVAKKNEIKDNKNEEEEVYIDIENVKNEQDDILDKEDTGKKSIKNTPLRFNTKTSSPKIKFTKTKRDIKFKKSDIMENKIILLDTSNSDSSIKNKSCKQENENTILLDTSSSSVKEKKKSNVQFSPKNVIEQNLIEESNESEITKLPKSCELMYPKECSTPKLDIHTQNFKFNKTPETLKRISKIKDTKTNNTKSTQDALVKKKKSKNDSILKKDTSLKEFDRTSNKKELLNTSLPTDLAKAIQKGLSKKSTPKMGKLHKTTNITHTESPTIRYLRKKKIFVKKGNITKEDITKGDITQTKTKLENEEKRLNLVSPPSDNIIQKHKKKQKKRKMQTESISSENIIDEALSQNMMEPNVPKNKKHVKLVQPAIVEDEICKDSQINEKRKKQKKKQLEIIEQNKNVNEENVRKNKIELTQRKRKNYKIVDNNSDLSADMTVRKKSKQQKITENKEIVSEKLLKKKKKEEKPLQTEIPKLKSDKNLTSNKLQNIASDIKSKNAGFAKARNEALEAIRTAEMRIKAKKELKKKKRENAENMIQEQVLKIPDKKQRKKIEKTDLPSSAGRLKRLPDDVIENLTDLPKAKKRQKLSQNQEQIMPLSGHGSKSKVTSTKDDGFIALSSSGSTTQFTIVNLQKVKKQSKLKSCSAATSFRQRVLARNNRESVSAYMMYLEKQKATSNKRFF